MRRGITSFSATLLLSAAALPAWAQRTDDNATTAAEDAFGTSVGDESIGIYNPYDVRGFSPVDAGNVRVEGLYFDQQADLTGRLQGGSTIRVGISAQGYAFPAPTGIADIALRKPGAEALASVGIGYGPWGGASAEIDVQYPLDGDRLGLVAGAGIYRNGAPTGNSSRAYSTAALARWAPRPGVEIVPFWGRVRDSDGEATPLVFSAGDYLPTRYARNEFHGQPWADSASTATNYGLVSRADPAGFDVRLGVFRSVFDSDKSAGDLLFDTQPDGSVGQRIVVIENGDQFASTSGELRVARSVADGPRLHTLVASARGRSLDRLYGSATLIDLGASTSMAADFRPEPVVADGPKTRDRVRQTTFGLAYQGRWKNVGELSFGVQKSDYTKTVTDPDPLVTFPETRDAPWLFSANGAAYLTSRLALYGGYTRGLEESPVAPREAVNLNEAPPAIHTRQMDAGVRWSAAGGVTLVAGVFEVEKPYYSLDPGLRFRQLGTVRNRGIELSVAGQIAKGLTLVAGNVLIDARVSGEEVTNGTIGSRPVGTFRRHTILSLDYSLPGIPALSVDAFAEGISQTVANHANTLFVPARAVVHLGARYRFEMAGAKALVRAQVSNVTGTFGWNVGSSGFFVPNGTRRFSLSLAADI